MADGGAVPQTRPLGEFDLIEAVGLPPGLWAGTIAAIDRTGARVDFTAHTKQGKETRTRLARLMAQEPRSPVSLAWLELEHGTRIVRLPAGEALVGEPEPGAADPRADAALLLQPGTAVAFTTADCLPIVISGAPFAVAIHAGWRSLADGIIEKSILALRAAQTEALAASAAGAAAAAAPAAAVTATTAAVTVAAAAAPPAQPAPLVAYIGPAIDAAHYEIDRSTCDRLLQRPAVASSIKKYLTPTRPGHWLADLPGMAEAIMLADGLLAANIHQSGLSTYTSELFYSVRRDGPAAGRMANILILMPG